MRQSKKSSTLNRILYGPSPESRREELVKRETAKKEKEKRQDAIKRKANRRYKEILNSKRESNVHFSDAEATNIVIKELTDNNELDILAYDAEQGLQSVEGLEDNLHELSDLTVMHYYTHGFNPTAPLYKELRSRGIKLPLRLVLSRMAFDEALMLTVILPSIYIWLLGLTWTPLQ